MRKRTMVTGGGRGAGTGGKKNVLGEELYSPREADLALSDRGLTLGGGAVPFFFSDGFAVHVTLVITVAVAVLLSFLFSGPLSLGGVMLRCVVSV